MADGAPRVTPASGPGSEGPIPEGAGVRTDRPDPANATPGRPTSRKTVLHLFNRFGVGGSEKQAAELVRRLDRSRFELVVATMSPDGPWRRVLERQGIPILDYPFRSFFRPSCVRHVVSLAGEIRRREVRLVHCHDFYSNLFGTLAGRAAACGCRVVTARREFGFLRTNAQLLAQRSMYFLSALTMTNSESLRSHLESEEKVPTRKLRVVHNGIDTDLFSPGEPPADLRTELDIPSGALVIGVVARLGEEKNHRRLIRALARLASTGQRPVVALIVGDGPTRPGLEALASELGVSESVLFLGERQDVPDLLRSMDVFVLPSLSEGFPNALLEAMATGLSVVASAVGGNRELVDHGQTGLLFAPERIDELTDRLASLLDDPDLREQLGRAARRFVVGRFSYDRMVDEVEGLYDELLFT